MANLLSTAQSVSNAVTSAQNIDVTGTDLTNAGINAALSAATAISAGQDPFSAAVSSAIGSVPGASSIASAAAGALGVGNLLGGLGGTKPKALHTEYAAGTAEWTKPYGAGTDIVFYLVRADGGDSGGEGGGGDVGEAVTSGFAGESGLAAGAPGSVGSAGTGLGVAAPGGGAQGRVPADVTAGAGLPDGMQSALGQVASAANLRGVLGSSVLATTPSLVGPFTGLESDLTTAASIATSATSALSSPTFEKVFNAVGGVLQGPNLSDQRVASTAQSEQFFNTTLSAAFEVAKAVDVTTGVKNLSAAPVSELSHVMAKMTNAVTSTKDFVKGINNGSLGFTSTGSNAEMNRTGPQGAPLK